MNERNTSTLRETIRAMRRLSDEQLARLARTFLDELSRVQDLDDGKPVTAEEKPAGQPKRRRGNPLFKKGQSNPYLSKKRADASRSYNSQFLGIIISDNKANNSENYSENHNSNYKANYEDDDININNNLNNINNNYNINKIKTREKEKREKKKRESKENRQMKNTKQTKQSKPEIDLSAVDPRYREVVEEWLAYKRERHQAYGQIGFNMCYKRLLALSGESPDRAREVVEQSIANNWAGLFELKNQNHGKQESYEERRRREAQERDFEFKQAVERIMRTGYDDAPGPSVW